MFKIVSKVTDTLMGKMPYVHQTFRQKSLFFKGAAEKAVTLTVRVIEAQGCE